MLPGAGDGTGVTDNNGGFQRPNINAQLQCISAGYPQKLPFKEAPFNFAAFFRKVTAAIRADRLGQRRVGLLEHFLTVAVKQLCHYAGFAKSNRSMAVPDELAHELRRLQITATALGASRINKGRIPEHEVPLAGRCAVFVDDVDVDARNLLA